jgi:hypothetical protein
VGTAAHGHAHGDHYHAHKLPPGVVISHGASGIGHPPAAAPTAASTAGGEAKADAHDHAHDHSHAEHAHSGDATAAAAAVAAASPHSRMVHHLSRYLLASFGDARRLDYGTGHEMNFVAFLYALSECGAFDASDAVACQRLVGIVFDTYLRIMRLLQRTYYLEPAGSRGVWGLDDYCFLPFAFGSSQLQGHKHIKPKSVRYPEILDGFSSEYMYLDSIRFIMSVKTCSFAEHSPMLNDITIIKTWEQVNAGLWKMYFAEVMGKFAVIQHFIYSPMLQQWPVQPLTGESRRREEGGGGCRRCRREESGRAVRIVRIQRITHLLTILADDSCVHPLHCTSSSDSRGRRRRGSVLQQCDPLPLEYRRTAIARTGAVIARARYLLFAIGSPHAHSVLQMHSIAYT